MPGVVIERALFPLARLQLLGQLVVAEDTPRSPSRVARKTFRCGIDHRRHQRPGAPFARGQFLADRPAATSSISSGRRLVGPRPAQHRPRMHRPTDRTPGRRRRRRSGPRWERRPPCGPCSDRAPNARKFGQPHGLGPSEPPGLSIHRQMKFTSLVADLLLDHPLGLLDRIGADRAFQVDADRPPAALQRRIVLDGRRRQFQGLDHVAAIGGQIADETQPPGVAAGKLAQLARPLHHHRLLRGVLLLQFLQPLGRDELLAHLGLDLQDLDRPGRACRAPAWRARSAAGRRSRCTRCACVGVIVCSSMPAAPIEASLAMMISWQAIAASTACPWIRLGQIGHGPHAGKLRRWRESWPVDRPRRNRCRGRSSSAPSARRTGKSTPLGRSAAWPCRSPGRPPGRFAHPSAP